VKGSIWCLCLTLLPTLAMTGNEQHSTFSKIPISAPLSLSESGRHLTYADGKPFYYVADTPWQLLASLSLGETKSYIDHRSAQGFTALQLVATPWSFDDTAANWDFEGQIGQSRVNAGGFAPFAFAPNQEPSTKSVQFDQPIEDYWVHVDQVLDYMATQGMAAYFIPLWASNFSRDVTTNDHRVFGQFVGTRYKTQPNIIWVLGGDEAKVSLSGYQAMGKGIREVGAKQLMTMHPRSGRSSSNHLAAGSTGILDFHSIQARGTTEDMLSLITQDHSITPSVPTFLCETWYEHDKMGGVFGIHQKGSTPAFRAHYWAARLGGGFGEGYGAWTLWLNLFDWETDIHRNGASEIATSMRSILEKIDWHRLTPTPTTLDGLHLAKSSISDTTVGYLEKPMAIPIDNFQDHTITWFDPSTGNTIAVKPANSPLIPPDNLQTDSVFILSRNSAKSL